MSEQEEEKEEQEEEKEEKEEEKEEKELDLLAPITESVEQLVVPVRLEKKKGSKTTDDYFLVEASGAARDKFMSTSGRRTKFVDGKPAGMTSFDGVQTSLLDQCFFYANAGDFDKYPEIEISDISKETHKLVPPKVIQAMAARIQNQLFERLLTISGMDKKVREAVKND